MGRCGTEPNQDVVIGQTPRKIQENKRVTRQRKPVPRTGEETDLSLNRFNKVLVQVKIVPGTCEITMQGLDPEKLNSGADRRDKLRRINIGGLPCFNDLRLACEQVVGGLGVSLDL